MNILPFGSLVADIAEEVHAVLTLIAHQVAQNIFLGDAHTALALPDIDEQTVEDVAAQRVVDESHDGIGMALHGQSGCREQFPVAIMSQIGVGHLNAATLHLVLQLIQTHESYTAMHLLGAHCQFLDNLRHIVAQRVIESSLYLPTLADGLLREELGFQGVVITDALNMKAVSDLYGSGDACVKAILAGDDLLLYPVDFQAAYQAVLSAAEKGTIAEDRIDQSLRRIFRMKYQIEPEAMEQYREAQKVHSIFSGS